MGSEIPRFFPQFQKATYIDRPNRFLLRCSAENRIITAHVPNPGRMEELLLPGRTVYLTRAEASSSGSPRKTEFTAVAIMKGSYPVMLHTHRTNDVARYLIEAGQVPDLQGARVLAAEVTFDRSRFDFLLEHEGRKVVLEVKSCTLFGEKIAMFPDAETARGTKHLRELAALSEKGYRTVVLFLVHYQKAQFFMPCHHTDLTFTRTFLELKNIVRFIPLSIGWDEELDIILPARMLTTPWQLIERESQDRGSYLIILRLDCDSKIPIGKLKHELFKAGYYVYVGSSMANLSKRIERHRKVRKTVHWHLDTLRMYTHFVADLPIRSSRRLECELSRAMLSVSQSCIPKFGSSDCDCQGHLFWFSRNPLLLPEFINVLQYYRIDDLIQ
ncbi:MAG: DNA/RNA nuclease SfsA [Vulcanimicrobiota bacterium]